MRYRRPEVKLGKTNRKTCRLFSKEVEYEKKDYSFSSVYPVSSDHDDCICCPQRQETV